MRLLQQPGISETLLQPNALFCGADVAYASLDYKVSVQYADTPYGYNLYNLDLIQAPCNWNQETIGSKDIAVCIIDSGIQTNHPDLAANIWVNTAEIPNNGIDDDGNGMASLLPTNPILVSIPNRCVHFYLSRHGCLHCHQLQYKKACAFKYIAGFSGPSTELCIWSLPMGADPNQPYVACIACALDLQAASKHKHSSVLSQSVHFVLKLL